ncbi:MAG TPA: CocE/NonD family hydrolase [Solirubrobacteraceae bacterium]|nr:CocE/NonD family hydrolase [Solirubrobacteraceae bacterium]
MGRGRRLLIGILACVGALASAAASAAPAAARDAVVSSFDGTQIAVHFYGPTTAPANGVAPTVLVGSPYPSPGETRADQDVGDRIGLATLRGAGYNVLTWDARGIGASGGSIMFDSPAVEGRDIRAIIDFVAAQPEAQLDAPGDPRVGMSGTSYGATIQYIAAALDARVDAIVPDIGWESLITSLHRGGAVKTGWLAGLCGLDAVPGAVDGKAEPADVRPASAGDELKTACLEGVRGRLSKASRKWLADHGPGSLIGSIRTPALIMQGTTDTLFPLDQASAAFAALRRNGVPVQMLWYCGGHVACTAEPGDPRTLARAGLAWLNRWLRRDPTVDTGAAFQWLADDGEWRSGPDFPLALAGALDAVGSGSLKIAPRDSPLRGLGRSSAPARNAVDVRFPAPTAEADLVGNPRVRLIYRGRAKPQRTFLYAQVVDDEGDRVLGGLVTPLPVILDGRERSVERPMEAIAERGGPASLYRLQITPGAATYEEQRSKGRVSLYGAFGSLPLVDATRSGYGAVRRTPTRPRIALTSRRSRRDDRDVRVSLRARLPVRPCAGSITFVVHTSRRPYVYNSTLTPRPCRAARKVTLRARRGSPLRLTATFNGSPELKPRESRTLSRRAR